MQTNTSFKRILYFLFLLFFSTSQLVFSQKETLKHLDTITKTITEENSLPGTSEWKLTNPAIHREIEGYASATSVNIGDSIHLFINTAATKQIINVYRMGWYNGLGSRLIAGPFTTEGTVQKIPKPDTETGLIECDWIHPFSLKIEKNWTSGIYLIKLEENVTNKQSYILFVVRNDHKSADILFQLPITTYQSYNTWGGKSLYSHASGDSIPWGSSKGVAADKVSFNRPYAASTNMKTIKSVGSSEFLANVQPINEGYPISSAGWDYNMVRWLEKNGYDVNYSTNIDTHTSPNILKKHKLFLSQGHDEYWTQEMKNNIIAARDTGVNLAFFGANIAYWQMRLEPSTITNSLNRTMVCYKNTNTDPVKGIATTVMFRNPPISKPEAAFVGVQYFSDRIDSDIIIANAAHPIFNGTELKNGDKLKGLLGYEVDAVTKNSPSNINILTSSKSFYLNSDDLSFKAGIKSKMIQINFFLAVLISLVLLVFLFYITKYFTKSSAAKLRNAFMLLCMTITVGSLIVLNIFQNKNKANMTIYTSKSGAKVFATGTIQWSWGLDDYNVPELRTSRHNKNAEIITHNVLELLGANNINNTEVLKN